ncbi:cyclopropane-fatty-acyl-phospholipid synthase family protein [Rhizobium sp. L1K21]|uniref:SAM-dependent methyltransferase n=1 Tax=Rhizobium sp. L1K21 TaxID=2954933 RepID=UPI0020930052|nr:cyclopropane-fatty-acyl-phospholipid synthase family protein [Rhizobium sp. L1K21]MCO6186542.1 cyclopropane-fatty-acyl-phospholipid synthase family protein [Rhizobium sp. L1K21]
MNRFLDSFLRKALVKGHLEVTTASGENRVYGDGTGPRVHIRLVRKEAERGLLLDPALKLGEYYMDGTLELVEGTMFDLLKVTLTNMPGSVETKNTFARIALGMRKFTDLVNRGNTLIRARHNVKHHYDLSGALYDLFLDSDRQYSCAYYPTPETTLEEAQLAKKQHIAAKLNFNRPGLKVLDIGCGWGGMGLYLARTFGAKVTGVTLSDEQLAIANQRAAKDGLAEDATFLLQDYRNLDQRFDRIVSVGMFEHVGKKGFNEYFAKAADLLADDGVMLMHTIGQASAPTPTNPFIEKYIFPGGYIPSMSEVLVAIEKSGLMLADVEVLRYHYAETLRDWRKRFHAHWKDAAALYDETFCRMWDFYLASSEAAFRFLDLNVFQFQLVKSRDALPMTRDYIVDTERRIVSMDKQSMCLAAE